MLVVWSNLGEVKHIADIHKNAMCGSIVHGTWWDNRQIHTSEKPWEVDRPWCARCATIVRHYAQLAKELEDDLAISRANNQEGENGKLPSRA